MIAEVIPNTKTIDTEIFSYLIPDKYSRILEIGSIVSIPFGRREIFGVVEKIHKKYEKSPDKLKKIGSILPGFTLPENYIKTAKWLSDYYLCSLGEAISLFLPPLLKRPKKVTQQSFKNSLKRVLITLSDDQQNVYSDLEKIFLSNKKKPALIHGVTGSGKTEVYLKLVAKCLESGKQAILLVPEIILTPQTISRFRELFADQVALIHSKLSKSEKMQCYFDFLSGKKTVLIGPRSALLVPSRNLGLIIIDEEHEDAYKQEQSPRYHAVELAKKIAEYSDSFLVLGSATPRVESYFRAKSDQYELFCLNERFGQKMPQNSTIDMKAELKGGNFSIISNDLRSRIEKTLKDGGQVLLFLNRRGTATFVSCRDCGHIIPCPNCSIPMVYHINEKGFLNCHHCDAQKPTPSLCPKCGSTRIKFFGTGIEKVYKEIENLFPESKTFLIDSRVAGNKGDYEKFYHRLKNHDFDIVIGTQIIAKGLDIENVDLVGVISADTGLNLPSYLASEKVFQILTQVAGRSGRRRRQGRTIIQTYWPEALPIILASEHDYRSFYDEEIKNRLRFYYPPFTQLIRVISENVVRTKAENEINLIAIDLKKNNIEFIGPGQCFYQKLHNKYRYHLIIKMSNDNVLPFLQEIRKKFISSIWDRDPVNLL